MDPSYQGDPVRGTHQHSTIAEQPIDGHSRRDYSRPDQADRRTLARGRMTKGPGTRNRYLRDPVPIRLGGLAANLARVRSFSDHPDHRDVVARLLDESKWFIEWTAPDVPSEAQAVLLECQRQLARWQLAWASIWADPTQRAEMAEQAGIWSQRFLGMSGLLQFSGQESGGGQSLPAG